MVKATFGSSGWRSRWRRSVTDPVLFCREFLEFSPHPGQERWLHNSSGGQNLLVTGNRWGKSLVQAAKMIHRAVFRLRSSRYDHVDHYRLLNLSITQDQANIVFRNCLSLIKGRRALEVMIESIKHTPFPRLRFGNGAEITARSSQNRGEYILGHDYDYINFDEVAFELHADYIVDEILTMRLADRHGILDLASTPCGRNWFFRKFTELRANPQLGYVQQGKSSENPHLSHAYLERKTETLPLPRVQQNIWGMFVETGDEILQERFIQAALHAAVGIQPRQAHHRYVHGWDLARKQTFTVGITLDVTNKPYQLVALERFHRRDWPSVYAAIRRRQREYGGDTIIDSTGVGDVALSYLDDIRPQGFVFSARSKGELLTNMQSQFESENVGIPQLDLHQAGEYWSLTDELREATWEVNGHCDALMALALALWPVRPDAQRTRPVPFRLREW